MQSEIWKANIGTIFPDLFPGPLGISCLGKAIGRSWNLEVSDLRKYALDKHKTLDDTPFGGGPGMVMKCDILDRWLSESEVHVKKSKVIYMSPRGRTLKQSDVEGFLKKDLYILCGRYEGVDSRLLKHWDIEEVSIGDYVLCGGEVAAMVLLESCVRMIPGVLGNSESASSDSFSNGLLEHDQYTRPDVWVPNNSKMKYNTPCVLKSGNHKLISEWKSRNSEDLTRDRRADLWAEYIRKKGTNVHS